MPKRRARELRRTRDSVITEREVQRRRTPLAVIVQRKMVGRLSVMALTPLVPSSSSCLSPIAPHLGDCHASADGLLESAERSTQRCGQYPLRRPDTRQ
jgi:hypothetical protein